MSYPSCHPPAHRDAPLVLGTTVTTAPAVAASCPICAPFGAELPGSFPAYRLGLSSHLRQDFAGSFPLTAELAAIVGADLAQTHAAAAQLLAAANSGAGGRGGRAASAATIGALLGTALAISFLERKLAGRKAVWGLLAAKARMWAAKAAAGLGINIDIELAGCVAALVPA